MIINKSQYLKIEMGIRGQFLQRMILYSRTKFQEESGNYSDSELEIFVNALITRAMSHELRNENFITKYIEWNWLIGDNFIEGKKIPRAKFILGSKTLTQEEKVLQMDLLISEYLESI